MEMSLKKDKKKFYLLLKSIVLSFLNHLNCKALTGAIFIIRVYFLNNSAIVAQLARAADL